MTRTIRGNDHPALKPRFAVATTYPQWVHNLRTTPQARIQDGTQLNDLAVREATGEEKQQWWDRAMQVWPSYDEYQASTDRTIPLFVLEPS